MKMARRNKYADDKQAVLHTKFPSTHFLSNPTNVDHTYRWCTFLEEICTGLQLIIWV